MAALRPGRKRGVAATAIEAELEWADACSLSLCFCKDHSARCSRRPRSVLSQNSLSPSPISTKTASGGGLGGRRMTEASTRARTPAMDGTASPNIHTIVKAQIVFLLSTLTEENFERNQVEIRSVRSCSFASRFEDGLRLIGGAIMAAGACVVCLVIRTTWPRHILTLHTTLDRTTTRQTRLVGLSGLSRRILCAFLPSSRRGSPASRTRPFPRRPLPRWRR